MERKTIIKTLLLIVAVLTAIVLIVGYSYTKAIPPQHLSFENQHDVSLRNTINSISSDSLKSHYDITLYLTRRLYDEHLIDEKTTNKRMEDFLVKYIPKFLLRCEQAFLSSVWDVPEWSHSFMRNRITNLKNFKNSKGLNVIDSSSKYITHMDSILKTMSQYDDAWSLSKLTKFESLKKTIEREQLAGVYKSDEKLKNCSALVNSLCELPGKIKDSHLQSLGISARYLNGLYPSIGSDYNTYLERLKNLYQTRINEFTGHYSSNSDDISRMRENLLTHQESILIGFIDSVTNIANYYSYDSYSKDNNIVYNHIDTYLGSESTRKELHSSHMEKVINEESFNYYKSDSY